MTIISLLQTPIKSKIDTVFGFSELDLELIQTGAAFIATILAFTALAQLKLNRKIAKKDLAWKKNSALFEYFPNEVVSKREETMTKTLQKLEPKIELFKRRINEPLTITETNRIIDNVDAFESVRQWLNLLEDFSTATSMGVLDQEVAFENMGSKIHLNFILFEQFINQRREFMKVNSIWLELEKLARGWSNQVEKDNIIALQESLDAKTKESELLKKQGIKGKV